MDINDYMDSVCAAFKEFVEETEFPEGTDFDYIFEMAYEEPSVTNCDGSYLEYPTLIDSVKHLIWDREFMERFNDFYKCYPLTDTPENFDNEVRTYCLDNMKEELNLWYDNREQPVCAVA